MHSHTVQKTLLYSRSNLNSLLLRTNSKITPRQLASGWRYGHTSGPFRLLSSKEKKQRKPSTFRSTKTYFDELFCVRARLLAFDSPINRFRRKTNRSKVTIDSKYQNPCQLVESHSSWYLKAHHCFFDNYFPNSPKIPRNTGFLAMISNVDIAMSRK